MKPVIACNDNLAELKKLPDASVDLVYIDPPFMTNKTRFDYDDSWESKAAFSNYMEERMRELHRVLKPGGSFVIHGDWRSSPVFKELSGNTFGDGNFVNEIIWSYGNQGASMKTSSLNHKHNTLYWYAKGKDFTYNPVMIPYKNSVKSRYNKTDDDGRRYALIKRKNTDGTYRYGKSYKKAGVPVNSVWEIPIANPVARERTGYTTQKPEALLERVINMMSNPGDVVLDAFAGSGTTCAVAKKLGRRSICIDQNQKACKIMEERLQ